MDEQDKDIGLTIEQSTKSEVGVSFTLEAEVVHVRGRGSSGREHIVNPDNGDAHPRHLLDEVGFEKIRTRGSTPINCRQVVALNLWNASLLIDLYLIARRIAKR